MRGSTSATSRAAAAADRAGDLGHAVGLAIRHCCNRPRSTLVEQIERVSKAPSRRASSDDLQRPELIITPREDLAAQPGRDHPGAEPGDPHRDARRHRPERGQVLAVRPADSDPRPPGRGRPARTSTRSATCRCRPPAAARCRCERVAEISFGIGPDHIQRYNQNRRVFVGADLAPGVARGDVMTAINNTADHAATCPPGVTNAPVGADEWQGELINSFVVALVAGVLLVFSVLVLLYRRLRLAAGQHGLAVPRPARAG